MENKGAVSDRNGHALPGWLLLAAGALWLLLAALGRPALAAGVPTWIGAGAQVTVQLSNPLRNRRSNDATVAIQLANGGAALAGPLRLVIGELAPAGKVSIKSPSGATDAGEPYIDLKPYLGDAFAAKAGAAVTVTVLGGGPAVFSMAPRVERLVLADQNFSVKITSPASLVTVGRTPIAVQGAVSDPAANLTLNGAPVKPGADGRFSANVSLQQGHNTVVADAKNAAGQQVTDSISVSLDMTPPYVTVESPKDGDVVYAPEVSVSGLVNDIVRGTVSEGQANVTVNGRTAAVANRSYSASNVPLSAGANTIEVAASDQEGNTGRARVTVTYRPPAAKRIELAAGDRQSATINTALPAPLKARLLDGNGNPVAGGGVVFRVVQGDGVLSGGGDQGQGVLVKTGADGAAAADFTLGSRAGEGNQRVRATAVGFDGEAVFSASAAPAAGSKVSVNSGNNQRGAAGQALPQPLVVVVTDDGANVVPNADIRFDVTQGSGSFQNGQASYAAKTDSDGRASAQLTLGPETGLDQQRATATLAGTALNAGFTATAFEAGAPGNTSISGVVLDNQDAPLPNVKVRVDGTTRQAQTDAQGRFLITNAPVGPVRVVVDGSTTTVPGEWPTLPFNLVAIAGVENPMSAPVHLVKLDTDTAVAVGDKDAVLTLKEVPGFKLEVKAGSVTFPDGKKAGKLSVTPVNADKIPMLPPNGMQPQFIVTIQPVGARFDPPARLTLPNVDGHKPGAQVEMYSFDHDLEEFVAIGLGTVSADGSVIASNPGVGVIKAGWHCGSQPGGSGCAANPGECQKCEGNCQIVPDDSQTPAGDAPYDCKKPKCQGGAKVDVADDGDWPNPADISGPCKKCSNMNPVADPAKNNAQCGNGTPQQACYTCKDGSCANNCNANPAKNTTSGNVGLLGSKTKALTSSLNAALKTLTGGRLSTGISLSVSGSQEQGWMCCGDCTVRQPSPDGYKYYKYTGTVSGGATATLGISSADADKLKYRKWIPGTTLRANVGVTGLPSLGVGISASGSGGYTDNVDCPGTNCGQVGASLTLSSTGTAGMSLVAAIDQFQEGGGCNPLDIQYIASADPSIGYEACWSGVASVTAGGSVSLGGSLSASANYSFSTPSGTCANDGDLVCTGSASLNLNSTYSFSANVLGIPVGISNSTSIPLYSGASGDVCQ